MKQTENYGLKQPNVLVDYLNENTSIIDAELKKIDTAVKAVDEKATHANWEVLDGITSERVTGWDSKAGGTGKRPCRFVVGTSIAGWTISDCDYLCDGTDDQVEINTAIQALPSGGGEIIILDGTYNITATIAVNKASVSLKGNGNATQLIRMWNSTKQEGVITVTSNNCRIEGFHVDGNKGGYLSGTNHGIYLNSCNCNTLTANICNKNSQNGIYLNSSDNNTIRENTCDNSSSHGIYLISSNNTKIMENISSNNTFYGIWLDSCSNSTITGNMCNNNSSYGLRVAFEGNNIVTGNICNNNGTGIEIGSSSDNVATGNICSSNRDSGIYVGNSLNNTISGNICNNNSYGISMYQTGRNTITGNTCIRGTGQPSEIILVPNIPFV